jgi:hypothetical protein
MAAFVVSGRMTAENPYRRQIADPCRVWIARESCRFQRSTGDLADTVTKRRSISVGLGGGHVAVKIVVERAADGSEMTSEDHDGGRRVSLRDGGHLAVLDGELRDSKVIAMYAPGSWTSAHVTD